MEEKKYELVELVIHSLRVEHIWIFKEGDFEPIVVDFSKA